MLDLVIKEVRGADLEGDLALIDELKHGVAILGFVVLADGALAVLVDHHVRYVARGLGVLALDGYAVSLGGVRGGELLGSRGLAANCVGDDDGNDDHHHEGQHAQTDPQHSGVAFAACFQFLLLPERAAFAQIRVVGHEVKIHSSVSAILAMSSWLSSLKRMGEPKSA